MESDDPDVWCERADDHTVAAAFGELAVHQVVVKPVVGQHSWRQARLRRDEPLPAPGDLPPAEAMIQPFLPAVETEGELSFVSFDRALSHRVRKRPAAGDYRIQASFGGQTGLANVDVSAAVLSAISVEPSNASAPVDTEIQFVADLPKTSTGKIMRRALNSLDS